MKEEYKEGAEKIKKMMEKSSSGKFNFNTHKLRCNYTVRLYYIIDAKRICINLKCIAGPHIGQRFRLEPFNVFFKEFQLFWL